MLLPFDPGRFVPAEYRVRIAADGWERAGCHALRRAVFCAEQGLFDGDDADAIDAHAIPLAAVAYMGGTPDAIVGTVRIHDAGDGVWWGSRLAVQRAYRRDAGLGTRLIRLAVCLAHARGAARFLAHVQAQNAALFHALHWRTLDEVTLHGRAHHLMAADLAHYPATDAREALFLRDLAARAA